MKLSQKLLALGGVTLADYACCPYDDYGMPHEHCTKALPEKTPFALTDDWRHGACKAWESNVDATFDGNDNECPDGSNKNENWGSCGFQRHFPWNQINTETLRNRGCRVGINADDSSYTAYDGCNCAGYGDAVTNTITCVTTNQVEGDTQSGPCTAYDPDDTDHQGYDNAAMKANSVCCNPNLAPGTMGGLSNLVDVGCATTACNDNFVVMTKKCWEDDILGRRNIQKQSLYIDFKSDDGYNVYNVEDGVQTGNDAESAEIDFSYNSDATGVTDGESNALRYNLAGVPFLGGVCKLFVPVPMSRIVSVQIAGVHVATHKRSVFPAKVDTSCADNDCDAAEYDGTEDVGTAYCFSVVNPAEGMRNNGNDVHNGNVAGPSIANEADANSNIFQDPNFDFNNADFNSPGAMTSLQRQAGLEPDINFFDGTDASNIGTQMYDATFNNDNSFTGYDSKVGANFDVVVHIHSEWCNSQSFWSYADMQLTGDYNNNNFDYPLNQQLDETAPIDQRTGTMYSAAQTGPLQLVQLRIARDDATTAQNNANDALVTAAGNTGAWETSDCYTSATSACRDLVDDYVLALQTYNQCDATTDCTPDAAALAAAKDAVIAGPAGAFTGGCLAAGGTGPALIADCNDGNSDAVVDELVALIAAAEANGTALGNKANALAALALAESNQFTHAHMDLMDKRHNQVASWNNVYQQDGDYLKFPNTGDEAFVDSSNVASSAIYDAAVGGATVSDATYLRWPNAGAFAAFYSFVACANPPHISNPDDNTNAPTANPYSIIYSSAAASLTASDTANAYAQYGTEALEERTLVMSQSDSDYRDESCDNRVFRGNLRQVGRDVTVCGPGQLPDTDGKRCTWNWNYNAHTAVTNWIKPKDHENDPEEWFDRNDPHSFDMWSTRKRRATPEFANDRKYAFNMGYWGTQQGNTGGATKAAGGMFDNTVFNADDAASTAAIEIPIQAYNFNLVFSTADNKRVPNGSSRNSLDCFLPSGSGCACLPLNTELSSAGFTTDGSTPFTWAVDYYDSFDDTQTIWHDLCGAGTLDSTAEECTAAQRTTIAASLDKSVSNLPDCQAFKKDGTGGYIQPASEQKLTFDAGIGTNAQVKTAFNAEDNEWEVSVFCNDLLSSAEFAALDRTSAQRDHFPDCFFGDELWFSLTYGSGTTQASDALYNISYNTYVSSWFSSVVNKNSDGTDFDYLV